MLRYAQATDLPALAALRAQSAGGTLQEAAGWLQNVVGLDNVLLLEDANGAPLALLAAQPVEYGAHRGVWFSGSAVRKGLDQNVLPHLLSDCTRAFAASGCEFALATPKTTSMAGQLERLEFRNAFPRRMLRIPVARNLLAQAEFDSMTVQRILRSREHYQPGSLPVTERSMREIMTQLYRRGLTVVSNRRGYGMYYVGEDTLQFLELQADNDHCTDLLLQAAAERTGVRRAQVILAENQSLYLGAGRRCGYGMLRFLAKPFPVNDLYFCLLL